MTAGGIIDEVAGLYRVIALRRFRETPGVAFDILPKALIPRVDGVDRVIHQSGAFSPGSCQGVERPWYLHPHQDDNLLVLHGTRYVDIFTRAAGRVLSFVVGPDQIAMGGEIVHRGAGMLVWPRGVYHRIRSAETGSASLNFATRYEGFDIRTNFSIYDLDVAIGNHRVLREGHLDQQPVE